MANQHATGEPNYNRRVGENVTTGTPNTYIGDNVTPTTNFGDFVIGGDNFNTTTTPLIADSNSYTITPSIWETSYRDEIVLSSRKDNRVVLKPNKKNFLIIKSSNLFVCWNEDLGQWDIFKLESFEEDFGKYVKPKRKPVKIEDGKNGRVSIGSTTSSFITITSSNASVIKAIAELDGNFYVDMEEKKVYEFSCEDEIWKRRGYGKFSIKTSRSAKAGEFKKKRQNSKATLLTEKSPNIRMKINYIPNWLTKKTRSSGNFYTYGAGGFAANDFIICDGNGTDILRVDAGTGNVGIGTTTPNQTITIDTSNTNGTFQLRTDGTITFNA